MPVFNASGDIGLFGARSVAPAPDMPVQRQAPPCHPINPITGTEDAAAMLCNMHITCEAWRTFTETQKLDLIAYMMRNFRGGNPEAKTFALMQRLDPNGVPYAMYRFWVVEDFCSRTQYPWNHPEWASPHQWNAAVLEETVIAALLFMGTTCDQWLQIIRTGRSDGLARIRNIRLRWPDWSGHLSEQDIALLFQQITDHCLAAQVSQQRQQQQYERIGTAPGMAPHVSIGARLPGVTGDSWVAPGVSSTPVFGGGQFAPKIKSAGAIATASVLPWLGGALIGSLATYAVCRKR